MKNSTNQGYLEWFLKGTTFTLTAFFSVGAFSAVIGNDDVIKLVKAGLDDAIVIGTIDRSEKSFDLSTDGIIYLKKSGVGNSIIAHMLIAGSKASPPASTPLNAESSKDDVCANVAAGVISIRYQKYIRSVGFKIGRKETESSGAGRAISSLLTFGIVSMSKVTHYALLPGLKSDTRSTDAPTEFSGLAIERGRSPNDAIKLVTWSEGGSRPNYARVLPIGEGTISYWGSVQGALSHAPLEKYVLPLIFEKLRDECFVNGRSVSVWSAKSQKVMESGEYAIFLEPDRYHDFAIDEIPEATPPKR